MDNKISTGNAGEYFVAGELERHGKWFRKGKTRIIKISLINSNLSFVSNMSNIAYKFKWKIDRRISYEENW